MSCIKIPGQQNDLPLRTMEIGDDLPDVSSRSKELITLANKVFGNSWSHEVTNILIDFTDFIAGKYHVGCQATVKVELSNGIYHQDIGYSNVEAKSKGLAIEKAKLTSVTDALMKVLSCFAEIEAEMRQVTSIQNTIPNISSIKRTKLVLKRPKTPPPPAQSTPKIAKSPALLERIQSKKIMNPTSVTSSVLKIPENNNEMDKDLEVQYAQSTPKIARSPAHLERIQSKKIINPTSVTSSVLKIPENNNEMDKDSEVVDLDNIFESSDVLPVPPTNNIPTSNATASSATMTDEEIRLERKRKQREKQEEYKRQMKEKEKERQNIRQDTHRPNAKF